MSERDLDVVLAHPRPPEPRCGEPDRAGRPTAAAPSPAIRGRDRSGSGSTPAAGAGYNETLAYSGARPTKFGIYEDRLDEALAVAGASRPRRSTRSTSTPARAGWPTACRRSRRRIARRRGDRPADSRAAATRSTRSTSAAGSAFRPGADERPIDLDAYAAAIRRALGTSSRRASSSAASPATTSPRTPRSCSARSSRSRSAAGRRSSGSISAGTSTAAYFIYEYRPGVRRLPGGRRAERTRAGHGRRPHQRGGRRLRRGLPDRHRSRRATSWRCSTPVATTRR